MDPYAAIQQLFDVAAAAATTTTACSNGLFAVSDVDSEAVAAARTVLHAGDDFGVRAFFERHVAAHGAPTISEALRPHDPSQETKVYISTT